MQPLGNKILVRDIIEDEKKTESGIVLVDVGNNPYRKVKIEKLSAESKTTLKKGDICLCNSGGVELEKGLWLCNENLLDCKL